MAPATVSESASFRAVHANEGKCSIGRTGDFRYKDELMPRRRLAAELEKEILNFITDEGIEAGARLRVSELSRHLRVSRTPVKEALLALEEEGFLKGDARRGFKVLRPVYPNNTDAVRRERRADDSDYDALLAAVANGTFQATQSAVSISRRLELPLGKLRRLLERASSEGWIDKSRGNGWKISDAIAGDDALDNLQQARALLEPAIILEPGYHLPMRMIDRLRILHQDLLATEVEGIEHHNVVWTKREFHKSLAAGARNSIIRELVWRMINYRVIHLYRPSARTSSFRSDLYEHLAILRMIESGNIGAAAVTLEQHILGGG